MLISYILSMLHSGQISFNQYRENKQVEKRREEIKSEAHDEAIKDVAKKQEEAKHNLDELVEKSTHTLVEISARPPLSFSSTSLIVDIDQVSISHKDWFGSSQLLSIAVEDIGSVRVELGPLYASLTFIGVRPGPETTQVIQYLKKDEAIKARRIIQGLIVSKKESIDLSVFNPQEIVGKLETLGQTQAIEQD